MARLYSFNLSDGSIKVLTVEEAYKLGDPLVMRRIQDIIQNTKNKRMVKDGFTPGWQENVQAYCGGRQDYDRLLKERGLVEIGKEYVPKESTVDLSPCANEEFIQAAIESGVDLSGQEQEAIKSGKYFKE